MNCNPTVSEMGLSAEKRIHFSSVNPSNFDPLLNLRINQAKTPFFS